LSGLSLAPFSAGETNKKVFAREEQREELRKHSLLAGTDPDYSAGGAIYLVCRSLKITSVPGHSAPFG
jgi:hypothetical protein